MRLRSPVGGRRRGHVRAFLGLGSNVGDRLGHLVAAITSLHGHRDVEVQGVSGIYETLPVGGVEQDPYLNAAVEVSTTLAAPDLLALANRIEASEGRDRAREERWGPRTLDIDVLLFGVDEIDTPELTVPHPRLRERPFVLVPLLEVFAGGALPDGTRLSTLLAGLAPVEGIDLHVRLSEGPGIGPPRPEGPTGPGAFLADEWERPVGPPPGVER